MVARCGSRTTARGLRVVLDASEAFGGALERRGVEHRCGGARMEGEAVDARIVRRTHQGGAARERGGTSARRALARASEQGRAPIRSLRRLARGLFRSSRRPSSWQAFRRLHSSFRPLRPRSRAPAAHPDAARRRWRSSTSRRGFRASWREPPHPRRGDAGCCGSFKSEVALLTALADLGGHLAFLRR